MHKFKEPIPTPELKIGDKWIVKVGNKRRLFSVEITYYNDKLVEGHFYRNANHQKAAYLLTDLTFIQKA